MELLSCILITLCGMCGPVSQPFPFSFSYFHLSKKKKKNTSKYSHFFFTYINNFSLLFKKKIHYKTIFIFFYKNYFNFISHQSLLNYHY
jgi:hypothetical protein